MSKFRFLKTVDISLKKDIGFFSQVDTYRLSIFKIDTTESQLVIITTLGSYYECCLGLFYRNYAHVFLKFQLVFMTDKWDEFIEAVLTFCWLILVILRSIISYMNFFGTPYVAHFCLFAVKICRTLVSRLANIKRHDWRIKFPTLRLCDW